MSHKTVIYEPFKGILEDGREVLVMIYRDPETLELLKAELATRSFSWAPWGPPVPLEAA